MKMTFYTANCRGNAKNSLYPNRRMADNEDDFLEIMAFDHVCAEFKNYRRSNDNFLSCDVDVMDCDNSSPTDRLTGFIRRIWQSVSGRMWRSLSCRAGTTEK